MRIGVVANCHKLGVILVSNKLAQELMLSINVNNKKCTPKLVFFNEKKNEKDLDDS